jgi:hypothetical protein
MALLSMVALGKHGSLQPVPERELVAHYGAAIAAAAPATIATRTAKQIPVVSEASFSLVPEALSALVADTLSILLPEASSPAPAPTRTTQPDSAQVSAFISALTQTCLRTAEDESAAGCAACGTL